MKTAQIIIGDFARIYYVDYNEIQVSRVYFLHRTKFYDEIQTFKNFISPLRLLKEIRKYDLTQKVDPDLLRLLEARELAEKI